MKLSVFNFIVIWLTCPLIALASIAKGNGNSAAAVASGAAEADKLNAKAKDVEKKLEKEVGEMVTQSAEKTKSLKAMLTTNSKSIAALTGLFKEVSRLTNAIGEYETKLRKCKEEVALTKAQQSAGPENDAYFDSASSDPLAGMSFFQKAAEKALINASHMFSKMQKDSQGLSLLQRHHRHQRRTHSEEENAQDSTAQDNAESVVNSDSDSTSDAIAFGLNTIGAGEEDMDSRVKNVGHNQVALPGSDPLEYGMYDFTGSNGVKIFDHDSLDPDVQRRRELEQVNLMSGRTSHSAEDDDDEDD